MKYKTVQRNVTPKTGYNWGIDFLGMTHFTVGEIAQEFSTFLLMILEKAHAAHSSLQTRKMGTDRERLNKCKHSLQN